MIKAEVTKAEMTKAEVTKAEVTKAEEGACTVWSNWLAIDLFRETERKVLNL